MSTTRLLSAGGTGRGTDLSASFLHVGEYVPGVPDERSTERLEERVDALERRVRRLTRGIAIAVSLFAVVLVPPLAYVVGPMGLFVLLTGVLALLDD